ncbi:MAG: hypothetical protein V1698_00840 [bacterium]
MSNFFVYDYSPYFNPVIARSVHPPKADSDAAISRQSRIYDLFLT